MNRRKMSRRGNGLERERSCKRRMSRWGNRLEGEWSSKRRMNIGGMGRRGRGAVRGG
jgi:hypothetical protein